MSHEHEGEIKQTANKIQDTLGGMAGKMNAKTVSDAETFVAQVAISDLYERTAATLVLHRSPSPKVRFVALKMIKDHTTSTHQLKAALEMNETRSVAAPPEELDERRSSMVEHLKAAPPEKLEKLYVDQQVLAHEEALTLLRNYAEDGDNAQLRSFCAGTAPVVERHLAHVTALKSEMRA